MFQFQIGMHVRKMKGYPFDSVVVAVFNTLAGEQRVVAESKAAPGLLHIFSAAQLVPDRRARTSAEG